MSQEDVDIMRRDTEYLKEHTRLVFRVDIPNSLIEGCDWEVLKGVAREAALFAIMNYAAERGRT